MNYRESSDDLVLIGRELQKIEDTFRTVRATGACSDEHARAALHEARRACARMLKAFESLCRHVDGQL